MKKWRNYGLWVSLASLILLILQAAGVEINTGQYNEIVNAILGLLVAAGIISNPKEGQGYLDSTESTEKGEI